jgi:hypothetical protein
MVDQINAYIYQKRGFYYFSRRVPADLHKRFNKNRVIISLRTRSQDKALRSTATLSDRLEKHCLLSSGIILDTNIPHINLIEHAWRRLKTSSSTRSIPLVGASLWAAKEIKAQGKELAFPKYCNREKCNANSASAALNK